MYLYKSFEYKLVPTPDYPGIVPALKLLGEEGWELCGIEYGCFIFKRELILTLD